MWFYGAYKYGAVYQYLHYGKDYQYETVARYIENSRNYWYNGDINYIYYTLGKKLTPKVYRLKYDFKKISIINNYNTQIMKFKPNNEFFDNLKNEKVENILYLKSTSGNMGFSYQNEIDKYITKGHLNIIEEIPLQHKVLYVLEIPKDKVL
jgi:hypothetical protein